MKWTYKGELYESAKVDWLDLWEHPYKECWDYPSIQNWILYVPKWDKCYKCLRFGKFGNGNNLKFMLEDIYNPKRYCYTEAKNVELVVKL